MKAWLRSSIFYVVSVALWLVLLQQCGCRGGLQFSATKLFISIGFAGTLLLATYLVVESLHHSIQVARGRRRPNEVTRSPPRSQPASGRMTEAVRKTAEGSDNRPVAS